MRFRKTVTTEAFQLLEGAFGEVAAVAVIQHSGDELVLEGMDAAGMLESRHGAAQLVGLRRREAGGNHRHPHRLVLEQRDAERLAQNLFKLWRRIRWNFLARAAADI